MNQYLTKYQILQNCQFGFRSKKITNDALITIIEEVSQDWNSRSRRHSAHSLTLKNRLIPLTVDLIY